MLKGLKLFIFLALLPLFLIVASPATAETWSTPTRINNQTNQAILPSTVTGPNGYLHTVWAEWPQGGLPDYSVNNQNPGIYYSYWNGDTWSAPKKVSQNIGMAIFPSITVTSDNKVHIIWEDYSSSPLGEYPDYGRILYSSSTDYGVNWTTPTSVAQSLDQLAGAGSWYPQLVKDNSNNLHVTFIYHNDDLLNSNNYFVAYYTKWNGVSWSTPYQLTVLGTAPDTYEQISNAVLAVDSSNNPHVLLEEDEPGDAHPSPSLGIWYTGFDGASWSSPTRLTIDGEWPRMVIDNSNNRHVIWSVAWYDDVNGSLKNKVEYVKWNGSTWSSPTLISDQANYTWWAYPIDGLTFDTANNVYVGWGERVGWGGNPNKGVQVSYKKWSSSSQTWSNSVFMRLAYDLDTPFLYKDKWDNQHFAWVEEDETTHNWNLWYSTVPINIQTYNPASAFSMTLGTTSDTLTIPSGSYASPIAVSAQIGPLPASYNPAYTTLPRSYTFRPHGLTFIGGAKVAKATIYYTDGEIMGTDERGMKIYVWDGNTNAWSTTYATSTNTSQNKSVITLPHFSLYGIGAPKIETHFQSPSLEVNGAAIPVNYQLINLFTGQPADPPAERTVEDTTDPENPTTTPFWDEYKAKLFDSQGNLLQTLSYETGNGSLAYNETTNTYSGQLNGETLPAGNYTLKVYLATIEVGSFTFHYTYNPPVQLPSVTFLPPLTSDVPYIMQDDSTLPFKFSLSDINGVLLTTSQDVRVNIKGINQTSFTHEPFTATFKPSNGKYQVLIKTKELGMGIGEYQGEVWLGQDKLGSINFTILQEGKAKGKN